MILDGWALEKAVRRHWFRTPKEDGLPFRCLPQYTQNLLIAEAFRIQRGE